MFEDHDPNEPQDFEHEDDQFFAALTLLALALLGAVLWAYLVIMRGVYGPPL